ncbi:MAG: glycoside hydrolase family 47 protein [Bacteroidales bacterium]|nr:glycoside hydrolase family 47 protein [Bacteroidales bacterium]
MVFIVPSCTHTARDKGDPYAKLASEVREETRRAWEAYRQYAWGHDVLLPLSKSYRDWYEQSLHISPIDAYSTLKLMGLEVEAGEIERYVADFIDFDKDIFVKTFEVNIRILGGLLAIYQYTGNEKILRQAEDFGRRLLPAFGSETGIPYYRVNLKTGGVRGDTVNAAEGGTYLVEMGMLSLYTGDPVFYQAARKASLALFHLRSDTGLVGQDINVRTGEWANPVSHTGACIDSYYEYLYKAWLLFRDPEIKSAWDESMIAIQSYLPEEYDSLLWYGRVDMNTGARAGRIVTLYDAFFPALLALSGDTATAGRLQVTWDRLWNRYGLEPMVYDYEKREPTYPVYDLNPEIIESAYYLYHFTGWERYREMAAGYFRDIMRYCRTDVAFTAVKDVRTMEQQDEMATFFFAETMKYLWLIFSSPEAFDFEGHVFSTEAHPYRKSSFPPEEMRRRLGI